MQNLCLIRGGLVFLLAATLASSTGHFLARHQPIEPAPAFLSLSKEAKELSSEQPTQFEAGNLDSVEEGKTVITVKCNRSWCKSSDVTQVKFKVNKKLGSGNEGAVFSGTIVEADADLPLAFKDKAVVLKMPISYFSLQNLNEFTTKGPAHEGKVLFELNQKGASGVVKALVQDNVANGCLVMESVTIAKSGNQFQLGGSFPTKAKMQSWLKSVFGALKSIHDLGYVHNDVRYDNIGIRDDETAVFIDLGRGHEVKSSNYDLYTDELSDDHDDIGLYETKDIYHNSEYTMCPEFKSRQASPDATKYTSLFYRNDVFALLEEASGWNMRLGGAKDSTVVRCNNPFAYYYESNAWKCHSPDNSNLIMKKSSGSGKRASTWHAIAGFDLIVETIKNDGDCGCVNDILRLLAVGLAEDPKDRTAYDEASEVITLLNSAQQRDFMSDPPDDPKEDLCGEDPVQSYKAYSKMNMQDIEDEMFSDMDKDNKGHTRDGCITECELILDAYKNGNSAATTVCDNSDDPDRCTTRKRLIRGKKYRWEDGINGGLRANAKAFCMREKTKSLARSWRNDSTKYDALKGAVCPWACDQE
uniref:Protein kinase domain-containing protein n=1 Tax=Chromera velia CCMP2878 TaxID=1169474 RepID=A0A0G4HF79_9ALVE|eukprot:Cvel_26852.t1-p1 / transcript=Cvel_26852.t1 / gene=Cvel_26852 / organism=Chromera_velia_CCMP2878 / gene_product=hypothetical protein / transcript_product=hypothetical protein / location=Cvel_scaffold3255:11453-14409(-) / protein_length=585 / sequence_SO=supercontig / SO=protein_coding / is_pseudo=false